MPRLIFSKECIHNENALYYFRKEYTVNHIGKSILNIFADARYKLYVNGQLVAVGPCKPTTEVRYYDSVDITAYLHEGINRIDIHVLQLAYTPHKNGYIFMESVIRSGDMSLCVWGNCGENTVQTDESWQVAKEQGVEFFFEPEYTWYNVAALCERISSSYRKDPRYENAVLGNEIYCYDEAVGKNSVLEFAVKSRPVPMVYFRPAEFARTPLGFYDAGKLTCGFVKLACSGKGRVKITYAECMSIVEDGRIKKRDRCDETGVLIGDYDVIEVDGNCIFEPYWMRTFRFVKVETQGDVRIESLDYRETGYPIQVSDKYDFGSDKDNKLFDISVNTLKRCMHETYMDCPFYEQLQYTMDTHLQILYTYQLTEDKALAEKAIDDFAASYRVGGLTQSRFPVVNAQYIPGFSLFFIWMLYEHARRFSDKDFLRKYIPIADGVVDWFVKRLDGFMVSRSALWDFVDWSGGYPDGQIPENAPMATYSLMLAFTLEKLAEMHQILGNLMPEYSRLAARMKEDVKARCYDEHQGMYADSPEKGHYSQHQQLWAVLCGLETGDSARTLLRRSKQLKTAVTPAYMFYYFRAYEIAGIYGEAEDKLNELRTLVDLNCTTTPEIMEEDNRSECHAWSAVAIYEFTAKVLGVTYVDGKISIKPYTEGRTHAQGEVATPVGSVWCKWTRNGEAFEIVVELPQGREADLTMPDGTQKRVKSGSYTVSI